MVEAIDDFGGFLDLSYLAASYRAHPGGGAGDLDGLV